MGDGRDGVGGVTSDLRSGAKGADRVAGAGGGPAVPSHSPLFESGYADSP